MRFPFPLLIESHEYPQFPRLSTKVFARTHAIANVCSEHLEFSNDRDGLLIKRTYSLHEGYVGGIE